MSMCIYSHEDGAYCDKHDHGAVTVGCSGEEDCPDKRVLTNYDLLISKPPEEMARFLTPENFKFPCPPNHNDCQYELIPCWMCWARWLKAPVEVDDGN